MYKTFLQMDLNVENQENNAIINITLKNLNTHLNYNIILEENDKIFKRKCIVIFILLQIKMTLFILDIFIFKILNLESIPIFDKLILS